MHLLFLSCTVWSVLRALHPSFCQLRRPDKSHAAFGALCACGADEPWFRVWAYKYVRSQG